MRKHNQLLIHNYMGAVVIDHTRFCNAAVCNSCC
jgi:hypothetical protein